MAKKPNYWTVDRIRREARKFKTRTEFRKKSNGAYNAGRRIGILNETCKHMMSFSKPSGYWTPDRVLKEAKKYKTKINFRKNANGAFQFVYKLGIKEKAFRHMNSLRKPIGFWNEKEILYQARKYKNLKDFRENNKKAYSAAQRKKILDKIGRLLQKYTRPEASWMKREILKVAEKCKTRRDFYSKFKKEYRVAKNRGWLDEIYRNLKVGKTSRRARAIYIFEFPDKSAYIGLTQNYMNRYNHHMSKNILIKAKTEAIGHTFIQLNEFYTPEIARLNEIETIKNYTQKGWKILNKARGGALGGFTKFWIKSRLKNEARKYKTESEFLNMNAGAYSAAQKRNLLKEICKHMEKKRRGRNYWTKEIIKKIASKYNTRAEFRNNEQAAYGAAQRYGFLHDVLKGKRCWKPYLK